MSTEAAHKGSAAPQLAAPGAGLPLGQRIALKLWYGPWVSRRTPLGVTRARFESFIGKILQQAESLTPEQRQMKVLVSPIQGLEDSSRFWSYDGVLEHLVIVSTAVESLILALSAGVVPEPEVRVANFKPKSQIRDPLVEFRQTLPGLMARLDAALSQSGRSLDLSAKKEHPWFGPFNARQWYWLLASHCWIHWQQAKQIRSALQSH